MENTSKKRFNIFDAVIVILLLIFIAAAVFFLSTSKKSNSGFKVNYDIEITNIDESLKDAATVGDVIKDGVKKVIIGTISGVEVIPYQIEVTNYEQGTKVMSPIPGRYTVILHCTGDGQMNGNRISVNGFNLGVGTVVHVQSKNFAGTGYCIGIDAEKVGD